MSHISLLRQRIETYRHKKKNLGKEIAPYFQKAEFIFSTAGLFPVTLISPCHRASVSNQANGSVSSTCSPPDNLSQ